MALNTITLTPLIPLNTKVKCTTVTLKDFRIYSQLTKLLLKHSFLLIVQGKCLKKDTMDRSQLKYYSISNFKIKYWLLKCLTSRQQYFSYSGIPREILQGGTKTPLGPRDRLRLLSKLRIWVLIKPLVNFHICFISEWWLSWLQCKCEWWSTSRIQKSKWILHKYFSKLTKNSWKYQTNKKRKNL